jgi:hypothetical protein
MQRAVLAAIVFASALANADPAPGDDAAPRAHSRVSGTLGLFTPTGSLGVEYTQAALPTFEIGAGVGVGFSGPQASIMPRLRIGDGLQAIVLGAGASGGRLVIPVLFCFDECTDTRTTALWVDVEAGIQATTSGGVTLSAYGGLSRVVAHGACTGDQCNRVDRLMLPYAGFALGHTL